MAVDAAAALGDRYPETVEPGVSVSIQVLSTDLHIVNTRLRMPFRFGITTLTELPHLFVRAVVEIDGDRAHGIAADFLPNKWLTKDPNTTYEQDIIEMRKIIEMACQIAR